MKSYKSCIALAIGASLAIVEASAAQWSRGVDTGIDKVSVNTQSGNLDSSSSQTRATISPFIGISSSGRRTEFSLNASLKASKSSDSDESDITPLLTARGSVLSEKKYFRLDSGISVQQRSVNSTFLQNDSVFNTRSSERVYSFFVGPRYERGFDRTFIGASYGIGGTESSETQDTRAVVQITVFEALHLLPNPRWIIGSRLNTQYTGFESAPSVLSKSAVLATGYQFRKYLTGQFGAGWDSVEFDDSLEDVNDVLWVAGMRWRIGNRVVVNASFAERSFGKQPNVTIEMNGRRSSVELSWTRTLGISSVADDVQFGLDGLNGTRTEATTQAPDQNTDSVDSDAEVLLLPLFQESRNINETVSLAYTLDGRVTTFSASVSSVQQENLLSADRSQSLLLQLGLSRKVSKTSVASISASVGESKQFGDTLDVREDQTSSKIGVQWRYRF